MMIKGMIKCVLLVLVPIISEKIVRFLLAGGILNENDLFINKFEGFKIGNLSFLGIERARTDNHLNVALARLIGLHVAFGFAIQV